MYWETQPFRYRHRPTWQQEAISICDPKTRDLVSSSIDALENLAKQSKAQMKMNFLPIEIAIKSRLARKIEVPNQRCSHCVGIEAEDDNSSIQFLQMQKNQLIDLEEHFERYCKTLPVFGFNNARLYINFIKSYLLPVLVNEQDIGPIVKKKSNNFVSFIFVKVPLLDILNFSEVPPILTHSRKLTRHERQKDSFHTSSLTTQINWTTKNFLHTKPSTTNFEVATLLKKSMLTSKSWSVVVWRQILRWSQWNSLKYHPVERRTIPNCTKCGIRKKMKWVDFLRWYNKKDVLPTLEAMQKNVEFSHIKAIDMLKLGCTLPNLANICLHSSPSAETFYWQKANDICFQKFGKTWLFQLYAVRCQCSSSRRESQLQCCCRNYEVACKQLIWLSNYGSQSPFNNKVYEWWKDTSTDQQ